MIETILEYTRPLIELMEKHWIKLLFLPVIVIALLIAKSKGWL